MTADPGTATTYAPGAGRVFEQQRIAGPADVDGSGLAHLDALARWLQDVAFADLLDADLNDSAGWVVRRTAIRVRRRPRFTEALTLRTFCSGLAKSVAERRTSISGEEGAAVEAEAQWVQVDPESRMPVRFGPEFLAVYGASAAGRRARGRLRHPGPPDDAERLSWDFRTAEIDLAGHVNNAAYWQIAEQHLASGGVPFEGEIEFRGGIGAGAATLLRSEGMVWVLDGAGATAASIAVRLLAADLPEGDG